MSTLNIEFRWNKFGSNYLMLGIKTSACLKELWDSIDPDDLYDDGDNKGLVKEPHISILGDIDTNFKFKNFRGLLPRLGFNIAGKGLSVFEKDDYDVLKLDIDCYEIRLANKRLVNFIPNNSQYPEFHPHMTIAYLKKGTCQKYINPDYEMNLAASAWKYSKRLVMINYKNHSKMHKVFLGGTCNGSTWREKLIPNLKIDYFNPVVKDWTPDCVKVEEDQKANHCDIHLYYIDAKLSGVYSIAEMIQSSHDKTKTTIIQINPRGFTESMKRSLKACIDLARTNGAITIWSEDLTQLANELNTLY